jgi:hypothetical protein
VVEPLPGVIPEREGSDTGGGGAIGAVGEESMEFPLNTLSISERLNALEDKNEILRVASHWLSAKINASQNLYSRSKFSRRAITVEQDVYSINSPIALL